MSIFDSARRFLLGMDNHDAIRQHLGMTDDDVLVIETPLSAFQGEQVNQWLHQKYKGGTLAIPVGWTFKKADARIMQDDR